jgi:hypothetical protein
VKFFLVVNRTEEDVERLETEIESIRFLSRDTSPDQDLIVNTLKKDTAQSKDEALYAIYRQLR